MRPHMPLVGRTSLRLALVRSILAAYTWPGDRTAAALRLSPDLIETKITVPNVSGVITDTISLTATLTTLSDDPIADAEVAFSVDGTAIGTDATDGTGLATVPYAIPDGPTGDVPIGASFAGNEPYAACNGSGTLTRQQVDTKVYVPDRTGEVLGSVVLRGYLYRLDNTPVVGKTLPFKVNDLVAGTAVTSATGRAEFTFSPIPPGPATRTVRVEWAGDDGYRASFGIGTLYVDKNAVYIVVMPRTTRPGDIFKPRALMRRLPDYTPLSGKTLTFKVDGTSIGTAVTGTDGMAMVTYRQTTAWTAGGHTCSAEFAGDDLLVAGSGSAPFTVLAGISFAAPVLYGVPRPQMMTTTHLDGDGFLDFVAPSMDGNLYILWGRGDGTFDPAVGHAIGPGGRAVHTADLNGDGRPDIIVSQDPDRRIAVVFNYGGRSFSAPTYYVLGSDPNGIPSADFNGDGLLDLAVAIQYDNRTAVLLNMGGGVLGPPTLLSHPNLPWYPFATDWNRDGFIDLAVSSYYNQIEFYVGDGMGGFTTVGHVVVGGHPMRIVQTDMDGDGRQDLVVNYRTGGSVGIVFSRRKGTWQVSPAFAAGTYPYTLHAADVDGDGRPDVMVSNGATYGTVTYVTILRNLGGGVLSAPFSFPGAGRDPKGAAYGDFNRDGKPDIATSSDADNAVGISLNTTP
ncbi:MAG: hypothetical protein FJX72_12660 [Armatimonadetes bacterium]|nr:hypothetical protein [Armatimonadota bacterium]